VRRIFFSGIILCLLYDLDRTFDGLYAIDTGDTRDLAVMDSVEEMFDLVFSGSRVGTNGVSLTVSVRYPVRPSTDICCPTLVDG